MPRANPSLRRPAARLGRGGRSGRTARAETLGREAAAGNYRGPLHGIPLGIKDIIDVAGMPTRAGSPLRANHRATADAPLVAALRRAGAIILGKTVTVEFACFDPSPTRNPWDPALRHTPGGSSSGSAVAVAMGMCLRRWARRPAARWCGRRRYCGIATCKPTLRPALARRHRAGQLPSGPSRPDGPIGGRPGDHAPRPVGRKGRLPGRCPVASIGQRAFAVAWIRVPPRLGLLEGFFHDGADVAIRAADRGGRRTASRGRGADRAGGRAGDFQNVRAMHRRIMAVEAAAYHRQQFAAHRAAYGPMIAELLDEGLKISAVDYADGLDWQRRFARQVDAMFEQVDVLVCPATDTTAPATLTTTGTPKFQAPWSCAGVPVVSIPCGLAADGMPAAMQLVARRHARGHVAGSGPNGASTAWRSTSVRRCWNRRPPR